MDILKNNMPLFQRGLICILVIALVLGPAGPAFAVTGENSEFVAEKEEIAGDSTEAGNNAEDAAGDVELEGGDGTAEETVEDLEENGGALIFAGEDDGTLDEPSVEKDKVVLNYTRIIRYEDWFTRGFTVKYDGKTMVAYCIEPKDPPPNKSSHTAVKYDKEIMTKALYYSYGYPGYEKKMKPFLDELGVGGDYSGKDGGYIISHLVLSYFYDGKKSSSDAFKGLSSKTKNTVKTVADAIEKEWPDVPSTAALSLDDTTLSAHWDTEKQIQQTETAALKGHRDNKIAVTVPAGVTMVKITEDGSEKYESPISDGDPKVVEIHGGQSFYFTAPESIEGTFSSGTLTGSLQDFQPYLIKSSGKQDIIYCGDGDKDSVEFTVEWEDMGKFILNKVSASPEITDGNDSYSLENAEYSIYDEDGGLYDVIYTDAEGEAEVSLPNGDYTLKEEKAPEGYAVDEKSHEITVSGDKTVFEHQEEILKKPVVSDDSPQTGDEDVVGFAVLMLLVSASLIICLRKRMD